VARGRKQFKDWVINQYTYNCTDPSILSAGSPGQVALPLTFSDQVRTLDLAGDEFLHSWAAIPEGKGPRTYAVRGHILWSFVNPAANSSAILAARITVHAMDYNTLGALVPGTYSLLDSANGAHVHADEPFAWQDVQPFTIGASGPGGFNLFQRIEVNATCNRRLENNEALYLVLETAVGSQDINVFPICRTLMAVEGSD